MDTSIRRAIAALTWGADAQRHFDLAADRIARALLDVAIPQVDNVEVGFRAEPARLVGGDYLDLLPSGKARMIFGLGDASGKSLAAALNALMLRYLVRGLVTALGPEPLTDIVGHANTVVTQDVDTDSFVTFMLGEIDCVRGVVRLVNAGHEPALVLRRDARAVDVTTMHGIVLGVAASAAYREERIDFFAGDTIVLYTDGLTEATDERGELFTIGRLCEAIVRERERSAQDLADAVFEAVREYSVGALRDDSTILVLRFTA